MSATQMSNQAVRICFFASLREATGLAELTLKVISFADLASQLQQHISEDAYATLLADNVRVALDQTLLDPTWAVLCTTDTAIEAGCEIAFLPPVTGG